MGVLPDEIDVALAQRVEIPYLLTVRPIVGVADTALLVEDGAGRVHRERDVRRRCGSRFARVTRLLRPSSVPLHRRDRERRRRGVPAGFGPVEPWASLWPVQARFGSRGPCISC